MLCTSTIEDVSTKVIDCEVSLRNGFIRKVYSIVFIQLFVTAVFIVLPIVNETVKQFMLNHQTALLFCLVTTFTSELLLLCFRKFYPVNIILFSIFTLTLSYVVSAACIAYSPSILLEAGLLTMGSVGVVTGYVWKNQDKDFSYLAPVLGICLWILVFGGMIRWFFPTFGTFGDLCWSAFGCIVFIGLLALDTYMTIHIYDIDEYLLAALNIYLDIINLFLYILQCLDRK